MANTKVTVKWYGQQVAMDAKAAVEHGLDKLAEDIVREARKSMMLPKSGTDYRTRKQKAKQDRLNDRAARRKSMKVAEALGATEIRGGT